MLGPDRLVAGRAGNGLVKWRTAGVVHEQGGRAVNGIPAVAPPHEGHEGGREVGALGCEPVFVTDRAVLVRHPVNDLELDQALEPIGQEVPCDSEVGAELLEASDPAEEVPKDEEGPAVADCCKGGRNGTALVDSLVWHCRSVAVSC